MSDPGGLPLSRVAWTHLGALAAGASPEDPRRWSIRQGLGPLLAAGPDATDDADGALVPLMLWTAQAVHLQRLLDALEAAGIPALVLKGAALALSHYARPALRPMTDLDVLVAPAEWNRARRTLEGLDWTLDDAAEHGGAFAGPAGVRLELHGALTTCPAVFPIVFGDLLGRARPLGGGITGRRLGDEDMFLHLALHAAFQHGFRVRLGQYVDFERLLAAGLDWERLFVLADRARALRPLAGSLAVVRLLLGVAPPPEAQARLERHVPAAVARWVESHAERPWRVLDGLPLARSRWALATGLGCRVRLLAGTLWPGRPDGSREVSPWKALARGRRLLQHLQAR